MKRTPSRPRPAGGDPPLELPAGTIARTATAVDDRLSFVAGV